MKEKSQLEWCAGTEVIGSVLGRDNNRSSYCRFPWEVIFSLWLQRDTAL